MVVKLKKNPCDFVSASDPRTWVLVDSDFLLIQISKF